MLQESLQEIEHDLETEGYLQLARNRMMAIVAIAAALPEHGRDEGKMFHIHFRGCSRDSQNEYSYYLKYSESYLSDKELFEFQLQVALDSSVGVNRFNKEQAKNIAGKALDLFTQKISNNSTNILKFLKIDNIADFAEALKNAKFIGGIDSFTGADLNEIYSRTKGVDLNIAVPLLESNLLNDKDFISVLENIYAIKLGSDDLRKEFGNSSDNSGSVFRERNSLDSGSFSPSDRRLDELRGIRKKPVSRRPRPIQTSLGTTKPKKPSPLSGNKLDPLPKLGTQKGFQVDPDRVATRMPSPGNIVSKSGLSESISEPSPSFSRRGLLGQNSKLVRFNSTADLNTGDRSV
jgi:hypothetical protein